MIIFKTVSSLRNFLQQPEFSKKKIGFVPTMGALHAGHIRLISESLGKCDVTVCSIFVNPTQFNNADDLAKYPVTTGTDLDQLEQAGCDIVFLPSVDEVYPQKEAASTYALGRLEHLLEGEFRPGHYQGVCQVVDRLLSIVQPHTLFLGQKDFQQCMVISELVKITNSKTKINIVPTVRESDGLAMSSRNMRLNETERQQATEIFKTLTRIQQQLEPGDLVALKKDAVDNLTQAGFKVDYVEAADAETIEILQSWDGKRPVVFLVAAYLNDIRLIDNLIIHPN